MSEKLKALLATGRISNLPTVWCNCLAAALLLLNFSSRAQESYFSSDATFPLGNFILVAAILLVSSTFIYVGGCFLGDGLDAEFDRKHKPDRPIPSGILSRNNLLKLAWIMIIIATALPAVFHYLTPPLLAQATVVDLATNYGWQQMTAIPFLTLAIILYSIYHKKSLFLGLPLIGSCRFFLIIFAASITAWLVSAAPLFTHSYLIEPILFYSAAVALYTICFASVARTESSDSPITWRKILRYTMLALPLLAVISKPDILGTYHQAPALAAIAIYAIWLIHSFSHLTRNKGKYVSKCLAGFCLLDACFIAQFGWIWLLICLALFATSLALQKIAPAT